MTVRTEAATVGWKNRMGATASPLRFVTATKFATLVAAIVLGRSAAVHADPPQGRYSLKTKGKDTDVTEPDRRVPTCGFQLPLAVEAEYAGKVVRVDGVEWNVVNVTSNTVQAEYPERKEGVRFYLLLRAPRRGRVVAGIARWELKNGQKTCSDAISLRGTYLGP